MVQSVTLDEGVLTMNRKMFSALVAALLIVTMLVAPVSALAASKVQILQVTVDGARVRKGPGDYDVITSVRKGGKVFYLGKTKNSFCYICTSTGTRGYMFRDYLKSYGSCYANQIYCSKKKNVPVYKKASTGSKKVTKLSNRQHVIVYQVSGSWAYIKTLGGTGGYVKKGNLKKAG